MNKRDMSIGLFAVSAFLIMLAAGALTVSVAPGLQRKQYLFCLMAFGLAVVLSAMAIKLLLLVPRGRRAINVCEPSKEFVPLQQFIANPYESPTNEVGLQQ